MLLHRGANLLTPQGPIGFPDDLWARQTTTLRSMDRAMYLDSDFERRTPGCSNRWPVRVHDDLLRWRTVDKYPAGDTWITDWATGRPRTDADYIVCTHIQVVYTGVNLTSPDACAQTTFS